MKTLVINHRQFDIILYTIKRKIGLRVDQEMELSKIIPSAISAYIFKFLYDY
jgi:hypothetical protein